MTYRPEREKAGFCRVMFRNGDWTDLARNEFEPITEAIKRGDQWCEAVDLHGSNCLILLGAVMYVGDVNPKSIAIADAEEEERSAHKKTHGDD